MELELELRLAPPNHAGSCGKRGSTEASGINKPTLPLLLRDGDGAPRGANHAGSCGKRGSTEAFGINKPTLPLLLRDRDRDGDARPRAPPVMIAHRPVGPLPMMIAHRLVGPPPVKSNGYVKVKMEGVPIARKVDLSSHASYDELHRTLHRMFNSSAAHQGDQDRRRDRATYAVTYQDRDGDWMVAGDTPYEDFASSAKRIKVVNCVTNYSGVCNQLLRSS